MTSEDKRILKVAIVGPESTGKSSMAKFLAKYFNTLYVPEYARYYCKNLNNKYTLQDELNMFYGQIALEDAIMDYTEQNLIFCDTTILTVKIWSDHLFNQTPQVVIQEIAQRNYDLYLLMDIDLPWEEDPLRDFPNEREHFMQVWQKELDNLKSIYVKISGHGDIRKESAIKTCHAFIKDKS